MKKMIQRVGACICCCLVCLQFIIQPASAFIPVVVGADLLYSVLASAAVTCGVTFSAIDTFEPVVDAIKNKMADNGINEDTIKGYIADGTRLVFDVATGAWKTTVTMTDPLWNGINAAVRTLYQSGTHAITGNSVSQNIDTSTFQPFYCYNVDTNFNRLPLTFYWSDYKGEVILTDSNVLTVRWGMASNPNSFFDTRNIDFSKVHDIYIYFPGKVASVLVYDFNHSVLGGLDISKDATFSYLVPSTIGTIDVSSAVENPDYDWENELTKTKVVEFPSTYNGDSSDDSDENKKLVYWPDIERYLQGKNAGDLASMNPTGIENPSAQPKPDPSEAVTDYTQPPVGGSEANTSLRGLLFSKFPFCIPWDIKNAFKLLVAAPVPPAWDIDLVPAAIKQQCGITADTTWHINMDGMEVVGTVARFCSTIGFCLALAVATRKIIRS